ncbi:MAG: pyruvate formate lyase family protein, partial [Promethearchaeota archaeon]
MKRTLRLKSNLLSSQYDLCIERIKFFTEIYKKCENEPEILKRAKATAHVLKDMTIFIREDELLVGNETSKNLGEKINLDLQRYDISLGKRSSIKKLGKRKLQPFQIEDNEIDELLEIIPFWKGKSLIGDRITQRLRDEGVIKGQGKLAALAPNIAIQVGTTEGHLCAGYEKILKLGYNGIIEEAKNFQKLLKKDDAGFQEKFDFYEAVKIYYEATINFSSRFSKLAFEMALNEKNEQRKKELEIIADMMEKFTEKTPESFYEAVQYIWFTQNVTNIIYQR